MLRRTVTVATQLAALRLQLGDTLCAMGQHSPALDAYQEASRLALTDNCIVTALLSPGNLLDRTTLREVKAGRIDDARKQANMTCELVLLRHARDDAGLQWFIVAELGRELQAIHVQLWYV